MTNGTERWANHQPVGGSQFAYAFDTIGNRRMTESFVGPETEEAVYMANALNQYTQRTVPGQVLAAGTAAEEATVVVKAEEPPATRATRHGEYFWSVLPVDNATAPFVGDVTATAFVPDEGPPAVDLTKTETHPVRVPATPEAFTYDEDGNLTADGLWTYTWDGENRLIAVESLAAIPDAAKVRVECAYDYQGRRVKKTVRGGYNGSAYTTAKTTLFVYDGWNLIAELTDEPELLRNYVWGLDLSGTMQGAGGIGGLLSVTYQAPAVTSFACFDGNGNVTALADASTGGVKAQYTYGRFGEPIRQTGPMAAANPFRWSTKYTDQETGLVYYGYRYYSPELGRWLSRDPIGEEGGLNLYVFVGNRPISLWDYLGLAYGERLTEKEAKQLACAINFWLIDAAVYNAFFQWGDADRSLTLKFLRRYMSKSGALITVDYDDLRNDSGIQAANRDAQQHFGNGGTGQYIRRTATGGDLATSIGRVRIAFDKTSGAIKAHFPSERYTFSDTLPEENLNVYMPYLEFEGILCCWKGDEHISDKWMHDLEIYGHAKSFDVKASWTIGP